MPADGGLAAAVLLAEAACPCSPRAEPGLPRCGLALAWPGLAWPLAWPGPGLAWPGLPFPSPDPVPVPSHARARLGVRGG